MFLKNYVCVFALIGSLTGAAFATVEEPVIVPRPQVVSMREGVFPHRETWRVRAHETMKGLALQGAGCPTLVGVTSKDSTPPDLVFLYAKQPKGDEAYELAVTPRGIVIRAQNRKGFFYGFQTLLQLRNVTGAAGIPVCTIQDFPRFSWRGLMLDEGRFFSGKAAVKRFIDMMATYKMNRLHWHLTDSEGWRIEIKKYPNLATVGGIGDGAAFRKNPKNPQGKTQFYTQNDIREIIAYANARCVEVVPEIDMPGHASAMNRAYPEFDGGGNDKLPRFTVNPGKEGTYRYLTDILIEVARLFPSRWIHFGGDEVHFANKGWKTLPDVQALMKRENLKSLKDVEWYFNRRMAGVIRSIGKTCAGWDEVVAAGLPADQTLVFWWRHDKGGVLKTALEKGYSVVLCPRHPCYFDFIQDDGHKHGRRWDGFNAWERVYAFPDFEKLGVHERQTTQVLGVQACLWGETISSVRRMEYLTYPRLHVLAESVWTQADRKDMERFRTRALPQLLQTYQTLGLTYYNPLSPAETPEVSPADLRAIDYIDPATPQTAK